MVNALGRSPRCRVMVVVAGITLLCGNQAVSAQEWVYTVRPGDNLWNLTLQYAKSIRYVWRLQELNQVAEPTRMPPGRKIRFPIRWLKRQPASARVAEITGDVSVQRADSQTPMPLQANEELQIGDRITTGAGGNVLLRFADGSTLAIRALSEVSLDTLTAYGDTGMVDSRVRLQRGRSNAEAAPAQGPGSRFEIHTPAAVSAVRGTEFRVAVEQDQPTARTEVTEGRVRVAAGRRARNVPENFGVVAQAGVPLAPPKPLLAAPDTRALPTLVRRLPIRLNWPDVSGAVAYRIQVARDRRLHTLLVDERLDGPRASFELAEDGEYFLGLRAVDEEQLEGIDALHPFTLDARPLPPVSIAPEADAKVRVPQPVFRWSIPKSAARYWLQLASSDSFTNPLQDGELERNQYQPDAPLAPGRYFWRLATRADDGELGPFGDTLTFRYVPPPPSPQAEPPQISKEAVAFRWQQGETGDRYHFQLSRREDFSKLVVDEVLAEPTYTLEKPRGGAYYMRISTVDADGVEGAFGESQRFDVPTPTRLWVVPLVWLLTVLIL